jgi:hypothetical protein
MEIGRHGFQKWNKQYFCQVHGTATELDESELRHLTKHETVNPRPAIRRRLCPWRLRLQFGGGLFSRFFKKARRASNQQCCETHLLYLGHYPAT